MSSMSPNKLRIKLNEEGEESAEAPIFICELCRKEFGSVKALGGHKRVHVQHQSWSEKNKKLKGMNNNNKSSYLDDLVKEGNPTCPICSKTFVSLKSLFGHMRCHPDRVWRGMKPPSSPQDHHQVPSANNPSSTVSYSSLDKLNESCSVTSRHLDLLQPLSGWSTKKSRRSRPITITITNEAEAEAVIDEDDDELLLCNSAVHGLMLLAEARDELSDTSSTSVGKKRKMKSVNLKDQLDPPAPPLAAAKCYKCSTCDKAFPSPQALGGHRSSAHNNNNTIKIMSSFNKMKTNIHDDDDDVNEQIPATRILMMHPPDPTAEHKCKICDKVFPSGQALGGHKRCHWHPLVDPPPCSSSPAAPADANKKPLLDFDLNELPSPAADDPLC